MARNNTKWTLESVKAYYAEHGCTFVSTEYKTMLDSYTFICHCGNKHTSRFESFYKHRKRCKKCAGKEAAERRRLSKTAIVHTLESKGFTYLNHYWAKKEGVKTDRNYLMIDYVCKNGHVHAGKYYHSVSTSEYGCMHCLWDLLKELERLPISKVKSVVEFFGMRLLSNDYTNNHTPILVECACGKPYKTTLMSITKGHRCGCQRGGENHYKYNPNLTDEERQDKRAYPEYAQWVRSVYERDNYTCKKCGKRGGELHAHHIYSYAKFKEKRTELANGVTLCVDDHKAFHQLYGLHDFTPENFYKFMGYNH